LIHFRSMQAPCCRVTSIASSPRRPLCRCSHVSLQRVLTRLKPGDNLLIVHRRVQVFGAPATTRNPHERRA